MDCWRNELRSAPTEADVVNRAADYLSLWSPRELAPLTLGWRELRIESTADIDCIQAWLDESSTGVLRASPGASNLRELRDYLWAASSRVTEIRARH